jgi:ABC-type microcin C transport system permease subunit YejE
MGTLAIRKVACSTGTANPSEPLQKTWNGVEKKRRDLLLRAFTFVNRMSFVEYSLRWSCGH